MLMAVDAANLDGLAIDEQLTGSDADVTETDTLLYLLELGLVPSWAVLVVLAREFIVSGLRMVVASEGTVIAASNLGKWKTAVTMLAIGGFLLSVTIPAGKLATMLELLSHALMTAAVVLTAWSGIDYLVKSWPAVAHSK